ncbi:hypothetical protein GGR58DRAFT_527574 [Xylaria digitata]|nr:hypothetical protein GGR58DRAFT_527574 [Xylaria digitata]
MSLSSNFPQQGQLDWVSLSKVVVPVSLDVLARLQGAGVQAITYVSILQLSVHFVVSDDELQRVRDAIRKLRVYSGASNLMYFGFGYRSLFRHLTDTLPGEKSIALCSCIGEAHSEMISAKILSALWKDFGYPEDCQPSHEQFKALIKACGGALATSPFPEVVRRMLPGNMIGSSQYKCSEPADIARALHALFDISTNKKTSVTIVGGAECSFIAAVAHWIFSFDISVEGMDGQVVFQSSARHPTRPLATVQVYVQYKDLAQPGLTISQTTYVLSEPKELLMFGQDTELILRTRVLWDRCLQSTFGKAFEDLSSYTIDLGHIFGGVARIHAALAQGEGDVGDYHRAHFHHFAEASYGSGFIDSVRDIFPELNNSELRRVMQDTLSKSFIEVRSLIQKSILALKKYCRCKDCSVLTAEYEYCLPALAGALVELTTMLSLVHFECEKKLDPTCYGLKSFYLVQKTSTISWDPSIQTKDNEGTKTTEFRPIPFLTRTTGKVSSPKTLQKKLEDLICLFVGYDSFSDIFGTESSKAWTAISKNGICVFAECLVSMTAQADMLCRIHVMPGRIARPTSTSPISISREFDAALDLSSWPRLPPLDNLQTSRVPRDEIRLQRLDTFPKPLEMTPIVAEPGDRGMLMLYYRISTPQGEIHISPGMMTNLILTQTGLISCPGPHCSSAPPEDEGVLIVEDGWIVDQALVEKLGSVSCFLWNKRAGDAGRLAALAVHHQKAGDGYRNEIILRQRECFACCVLAAPRLRKEHRGRSAVPWIYHII